jgi:hypothetical protein
VLLDNVIRVSIRISEHIKKIVTYEKKIQQDNGCLNFLEWNKIFMVAENNPNGLNKYKDSPSRLPKRNIQFKGKCTWEEHTG